MSIPGHIVPSARRYIDFACRYIEHVLPNMDSFQRKSPINRQIMRKQLRDTPTSAYSLKIQCTCESEIHSASPTNFAYIKFQNLPHIPQHPSRGGGLGSRPKKNVREDIGGWGRVPFNETYAPSLSTIYDGA